MTTTQRRHCEVCNRETSHRCNESIRLACCIPCGHVSLDKSDDWLGSLIGFGFLTMFLAILFYKLLT